MHDFAVPVDRSGGRDGGIRPNNAEGQFVAATTKPAPQRNHARRRRSKPACCSNAVNMTRCLTDVGWNDHQSIDHGTNDKAIPSAQ
jgi:hypothetical protein